MKVEPAVTLSIWTDQKNNRKHCRQRTAYRVRRKQQQADAREAVEALLEIRRHFMTRAFAEDAAPVVLH